MIETINSKNFSKVLVLQGGVSEEKEVSDLTAESCIEALEKASFDVEALSLDARNINELAELVSDQEGTEILKQIDEIIEMADEKGLWEPGGDDV